LSDKSSEYGGKKKKGLGVEGVKTVIKLFASKKRFAN